MYHLSKLFQCRAGDRVKIAVSTHTGMVRSNNEDSFTVNGITKRPEDGIYSFVKAFDGDSLLLAVCDGMGGEDGGEIASGIAVKNSLALYNALKYADSSQITAAVNGYVKETNAQICRELGSSESKCGGSTLALAYIRNNIVYAYSLGDSRIYLFGSGELKRISSDHTLAMLKYNAGIYTLEEAERSPDRHRLTLFLGADVSGRGLTAQAYEPFKLTSESKLLLCSDGLYDMCGEQEISEVLSSRSKNCAQSLVDAAVKNGGTDNITCIVAERIG